MGAGSIAWVTDFPDYRLQSAAAATEDVLQISPAAGFPECALYNLSSVYACTKWRCLTNVRKSVYAING
jgi:hypothetical protein